METDAKKLMFAIAAWVFLSGGVQAKIVISNAVARDVSMTYGFYEGQSASLEQIASQFPDLARQAELRRLAFDAKFGSGLEEMDRRMMQASAEGWQQIKADLRRQVRDQTSEINLTRADATQFLDEVSKRNDGNIASPVIETLLTFNPRYQAAPVREFLDGYRQRFNSDGAGKAKGVPFSISAPLSWTQEEGERPNIVTKFTSENGRGLEVFMVGIFNLPEGESASFSRQDIEAILEGGAWADFLPEDSLYRDSGPIQLETQHGFWVEFDTIGTRGRSHIKTRSMVLSLIHHGKLIQLFGQVGAQMNEDNLLTERFDRHEPLFDQMFNSLVLPNEYAQ